jgi:HAMP domain-containing protein
VRRTELGRARTYRLASSIRVPWAVGLVSFLALALAASALIGRTSSEEAQVPKVARDYQEALTNGISQTVRRAVNEGIDDLAELAGVVTSVGASEPHVLAASLSTTADVHGRYAALYVLAADGRVVASVGGPPLPGLLELPETPHDPGMNDARLAGEQVVIQQFAPITSAGSGSLLLVGHYDPRFLRFSLGAAIPGEAWIVNDRGEALGSVGAWKPFAQLPRQALRDAAARAVAGESGVAVVGGSIDSQELVGYAPVTGVGPAGQLGWGVVTTRSVSSLALPAGEARRQGILLGIVTAMLALLVFGWLYLVVIHPIARIQREAERLAYGDLSKAVEVIRYDEIGLVGRALERLRILLIRKSVRRPGSGEE